MSNRTSHRRAAEHQTRVLEMRRSSATDRHKSPKDYRRKPKHRSRGWGE